MSSSEKILPNQLIAIYEQYSYPVRGLIQLKDRLGNKVHDRELKKRSREIVLSLIDSSYVSKYFKAYLNMTWPGIIEKGFGSVDASLKAIEDDFGICEARWDKGICESETRAYDHEREYFLRSRRFLKWLIETKDTRSALLLEEKDGEAFIDRWENYLVQRQPICSLL